MKTLRVIAPIEAYLSPARLIDADHPAVRQKAQSLASSGGTECDTVRRVFEFVRDEIAHSWDIQSRRMAANASDVLHYGEGICYGKSHLLAALLRAMDIPCGVCYQRLTLGDTPDTGYCIHALSAVYLQSLGRWIRLDARGNKPGVDAQFSLGEERLAFPIRGAFGEKDYPNIYAEPHPRIVETLAAYEDCLLMYQHGLPTDL